MASLRAQHLRKTNEVDTKHKEELAGINLRIAEANERIKLMQLATQHEADLRKLRLAHRAQLTLAVRSQKAQTTIRFKKWREVVIPEADDIDDMLRSSSTASASGVNISDRSPGSMSGIPGTSSLGGSVNGGEGSVAGSAMSLMSVGGMASSNGRSPSNSALSPTQQLQQQGLADDNGAGGDGEHGSLGSAKRDAAEEAARAELDLSRLVEELNAAIARQLEEMKRLQRDQADELRRFEAQIKAGIDELDLGQDTETRTLRKTHESNVNEIIATQQREYIMDRSIRISERKMLTERRVLNSVLDTIADGIINIKVDGTITRFNTAAEKMFGYTPKEIIGKNIRSLTPDSIAPQHDSYLNNYLTTG
ncbi:hypothetical protein BC828DRAFT_45763, partial [Blastocladiella britannica]